MLDPRANEKGAEAGLVPDSPDVNVEMPGKQRKAALSNQSLLSSMEKDTQGPTPFICGRVFEDEAIVEAEVLLDGGDEAGLALAAVLAGVVAGTRDEVRLAL